MGREEIYYALNILSKYPGETKPELIDTLKKKYSTLNKWDNLYIKKIIFYKLERFRNFSNFFLKSIDII